MGFRNPLTSLSAGQITAGTLPASVIAQAVASAASGARITLQQAGALGQLAFFAGISGESPATVQASSAGGVAGDQTLRIIGGTNAITLPSTGAPEIDVYSHQAPDGSWRSAVAVHADDFYLPDTGWLNVPLTAGVTGFTNSDWNGFTYRRVGGVVYISGAVQQASGPFGANGSAGTLPDGFRPAKSVALLASSGPTWLISPNGVIRTSQALTTNIVAVSGAFQLG